MATSGSQSVWDYIFGAMMDVSPLGTSRPENLPSLTGLRFLAAFCVLVGHSSHIVPGTLAPKHLALGYHIVFFGMTLFFVLSGFVITYNYIDLFQTKSLRQATLRFLSARTARLMPLYFVLLIATLATAPLLIRWKTQGHYLPLYITQSESFLNFYSNNKHNEGFAYFGNVWSIAVEWSFYLCFPVFAMLFARIRTKRAAFIWFMICLFVGVGAIYLVVRDQSGRYLSWCIAVKGNPPPDFQGLNIGWTYGNPSSRMFEFVLGCIAARFFLIICATKPSRLERRIAHAGFALGCIVTILVEKYLSSCNPLVLAALKPQPDIPFLAILRMNLLHAPFIAYTIIYTTRYSSLASIFLNWRPIVLAGEASYSIYMLHPWLVGLFQYSGPSPAHLTTSICLEAVFRCSVIYLFIIILARGLYLMIEVPGKDFVRKAARRLESPSVPAFVTRSLILLVYLLPAIGIWISLQIFYMQS